MTTDLETLETLARSGNGDALASLVKHYRGSLSQREYAKLVRLNQRTLEGVEQGRGIAHPGMFILAMRYVEAGHDTAADAGTGGEGAGDRDRHAGGDAQGRRHPVHQYRPRQKA